METKGAGAGWLADRRANRGEATAQFSAPHATNDAGSSSTACPSVLDVARLESGDVNESERLALGAHALRCARCEACLLELREARREILGVSDNARSRQSRLAADEIQNLLRRRLH